MKEEVEDVIANVIAKWHEDAKMKKHYTLHGAIADALHETIESLQQQLAEAKLCPNGKDHSKEYCDPCTDYKINREYELCVAKNAELTQLRQERDAYEANADAFEQQNAKIMRERDTLRAKCEELLKKVDYYQGDATAEHARVQELEKALKEITNWITHVSFEFEVEGKKEWYVKERTYLEVIDIAKRALGGKE